MGAEELGQQLRTFAALFQIQFLAPHDSSQLSITLVPEDEMSSSALCKHQTFTWCAHTHTYTYTVTHICKNKFIKLEAIKEINS